MYIYYIYMKYTVAELKKICKSKGIKGYSKMKKAELMKHCLKSKSPAKKKTPKKKKRVLPKFVTGKSPPKKKVQKKKVQKKKSPGVKSLTRALPKDIRNILKKQVHGVEYLKYKKAYKDLSEGEFWDTLSGDEQLSPKFIEHYKNKLDWEVMSEWQDLPEKLLLKYKNKVDWNVIRYHNYTFSDSFLQKVKNKVNWRMIKDTQNLSDKTEKKFSKYLNKY